MLVHREGVPRVQVSLGTMAQTMDGSPFSFHSEHRVGRRSLLGGGESNTHVAVHGENGRGGDGCR